MGTKLAVGIMQDAILVCADGDFGAEQLHHTRHAMTL